MTTQPNGTTLDGLIFEHGESQRGWAPAAWRVVTVVLWAGFLTLMLPHLIALPIQARAWSAEALTWFGQFVVVLANLRDGMTRAAEHGPVIGTVWLTLRLRSAALDAHPGTNTAADASASADADADAHGGAGAVAAASAQRPPPVALPTASGDETVVDARRARRMLVHHHDDGRVAWIRLLDLDEPPHSGTHSGPHPRTHPGPHSGSHSGPDRGPDRVAA